MSSSTVHYKFLKAFACAHISDGFMEDDGDKMLGYFMKMQGSIRLALAEVRELKDKGNGFFRQNDFEVAAACYDEACKLLSLCLGNIGGEDTQSLSDLAVSFISNMAACALKLEEYRAAAGMCSMILDTFPCNVKALFRRAVAYMKLKRFSLAELDLVEALTVEPGNKDLLRELDVVKGHLLIKENGKRVLERATEDGVDEKSKKPVHILASHVGIKDCDSLITEVMENHSDANIKENQSVNMEVTEAQNICAKKSFLEFSTNSVLEFSKKGDGSSRLRIPAQSYKKLLDGKNVSFYRKCDLSTLTIRILKSEVTKERDSIREGCKNKKKRRRRPKKGKSRTMGAMEDTTPHIINVKSDFPSESLNVFSEAAVTSSASSTSDNFSPPSTHIPEVNLRGVDNDPKVSVSLVNDKATYICYPAQKDYIDHQPFIFSARPKKRKIYSFEKPPCAHFTHMLCRYSSAHHVLENRGMVISKKNHSHRDESPRHNLSIFSKSRSLSHKFLRPRGVSVSCCRYSPKAQKVKKRKDMASSAYYSNNFLKKPRLLITPAPSLSFCNNNVVFAPDLEMQVKEM